MNVGIPLVIDITQVETEPSFNNVSLMWSSTVEPNIFQILRYEIAVRYLGPCEVNSFSTQIIIITHTSITNYYVQNLEESSSYEVVITAVLETGQENSTNRNITTLGAGKPRKITSEKYRVN